MANVSTPNTGDWAQAARGIGNLLVAAGMALTEEQEQILFAAVHAVWPERPAVPAAPAAEPVAADTDGWEANAVYLLDRCPFTVRRRPGGGPEDLLASLVVTFMGMQRRLTAPRAAPAAESREPLTLTARELELIDGMIEVQLHHAKQCDGIANRTMADKQKGWDMERVALLRKIRAHGIGAPHD